MKTAAVESACCSKQRGEDSACTVSNTWQLPSHIVIASATVRLTTSALTLISFEDIPVPLVSDD